jgi:hypothetical protein
MTRKAAVGWGLSVASAVLAVVAAIALVATRSWPEVIAAGALAASTALGTLAGAWGKWGE